MEGKYRKALDRLLKEIEAEVRETSNFTGRAQLAPAVMAAMAKVARHDFVDAEERAAAYGNYPLPIGHGQTISQPYIVALMTDLLDLEPSSRVLEVGTGSGYQAAILGELAGQVYSVEIIQPLADSAQARLERMGYDNVSVRCSNGRAGWPEQAPFDAIMVTAAAESIPPALTEQLAPGGRMIIPVGAPWGGQELVLVTKDADGVVDERCVLSVAFVPLTGSNPPAQEQPLPESE
jgi:protein-L-isoaspartate(D-aspartate) O-methyltransferase